MPFTIILDGNHGHCPAAFCDLCHTTCSPESSYLFLNQQLQNKVFCSECFGRLESLLGDAVQTLFVGTITANVVTGAYALTEETLAELTVDQQRQKENRAKGPSIELIGFADPAEAEESRRSFRETLARMGVSQ